MKRAMKIILTSAAIIISAAMLPGDSAMKAEAAGPKKAFIVSHFHCDPVWTNTQAGEIMRSIAIVHQQLEYAAQEPRFRFILSEIDYLKPYWDAYPWNRSEILELSRAGRAEFTGGYCEPDEAEVGGEALIRNFAYGKIFKEAFFDTEVVTAAQHDVFGHTVQLPQILLGTGHRYAQFSRGNLTDLPSEFNWLAPDGSKILTKSIGYGGSASDASFMARDSSFYGLTRNAMFMSGGDFNEPDRSIGLRLKKTKDYMIISGTHRDFFRSVEKELESEGTVVPEISRDHAPLLVGCYTSRIETKWANRIVENLLTDAEKFGTINSLLTGAPYPWPQLDKAWRQLLFAQHHDALPGTSTENVNLDLLIGWREAAKLANDARAAALDGIASQIDTASAPDSAAIPIVIFNSLNWERNDAVEALIQFTAPVKAFKITTPTGDPVLFQLKDGNAKPPFTSAHILIAPESVPQIGYAVVYASPADSFPAGAVPTLENSVTAENEFYKIILDPDRGGGISSLKMGGVELINSAAGVGNEIYSIKENAEKVEAPWSIHATGQFWRTGAYPAAEIKLERGAVRNRLIVRNAPRRETAKIFDRADNVKETRVEEVLPELVQEIILYRNSRRIDFVTHMIDFKESDIMFKVGFPAALPGAVPVFEERFAAVARERNTEDFLFYDFWREPGVKRGREYPAHNWISLSPQISFDSTIPSLIDTEKYPLFAGEIIVPDNPAVMKIANTIARAFAAKGVTTTITTHKKERSNEYYGFRVSLGIGAENAYTAKLLESLGGNSRKMLDDNLEQNGMGILFVKHPESVTETPDRRLIPILIAVAESENDLEEIVDIVKSMEWKTDGAGMALINNGNPGNSVESNGTMTLTLMRSITGWPAGRGYSENWETQHWNHSFRYSILPYRGGWLEAGVTRHGYDFNMPMTAVQTNVNDGTLPAGGASFFKTDAASPDMILSSLKPAGFPLIDGKVDFDQSRDISIRFFNSGYRDSTAELTSYFPISSARSADMLDRPENDIDLNGNSFRVSAAPFKIETYLLGVDSKNSIFAPPAETPKPEAPDYVRYWETNENVAPEGFMPVSVTLEPAGYSEDLTALRVRAAVASNVKNRDVEGNIEIRVPDGAEVAGDTHFILKPLEYKFFDLEVTGLERDKLSRRYISAVVAYGGREYEDVLRFSDWKAYRGDIEAETAASPDTDDSGWETLPLARFWSRAADSGTTWYRRKIFVPRGMGDIQMTFERPRDAEVEVYVNGRQVRKEGPGLQYPPLIESGPEIFNYDAENLIAVRFSDSGSGPAWCTALKGSEALFNKNVARLSAGNLAVKRGGTSSFKVIFENPLDQKVAVKAALAGPIETWPEGGAYSLINVTPYSQAFSAGPGEAVEIDFDVYVPPDAMPGPHVAAVKLIFTDTAVYTDTIHIKVE